MSVFVFGGVALRARIDDVARVVDQAGDLQLEISRGESCQRDGRAEFRALNGFGQAVIARSRGLAGQVPCGWC